MKLTLAEILKGLIKEAVSTDEVLDAIQNKKYVKIKYDDGKVGNEGNPKGPRVIQPVAVGTTKRGYPVVRAFQPSANSRKGSPNWKFFRLDRIESWKPYKRKRFNALPDEKYGAYNRQGDKTMGTFIDNAKFDEPLTTLDKVRSDWENIKNGPKLSTKNVEGPINATQQIKKNVFNRQHYGDKHAAIAKNTADAINNFDAEKGQDFWDIYDLAAKEAEQQNRNNPQEPQQQGTGPIHNSGYDEDYYEIDDVDFDENNFTKNKNLR